MPRKKETVITLEQIAKLKSLEMRYLSLEGENSPFLWSFYVMLSTCLLKELLFSTPFLPRNLNLIVSEELKNLEPYFIQSQSSFLELVKNAAESGLSTCNIFMNDDDCLRALLHPYLRLNKEELINFLSTSVLLSNNIRLLMSSVQEYFIGVSGLKRQRLSMLLGLFEEIVSNMSLYEKDLGFRKTLHEEQLSQLLNFSIQATVYAGCIATQYFVIQPLFKKHLRAHSKPFVINNKPINALTNTLTSEKANEEIKKLEKLIKERNESITTKQLLACSLVFVVLNLSGFIYESYIFIFFMLSSAAKIFFKETYDNFQQNRLDKKLSLLQEYLTDSLKNLLKEEIKCYKNETLDSSYFLISIKKYPSVSFTETNEIVKTILVGNEVELIEHDDHKLAIRGSTYLHKKKIQTINQKIQESLNNISEAINLKKQILLIDKLFCNKTEFNLKQDKSGIFYYRGYTFIPDIYYLSLQKIFTQCTVKLKEKFLIISGCKSAIPEVFLDFYNQLSAKVIETKENDTQEVSMVSPMPTPSNKRGRTLFSRPIKKEDTNSSKVEKKIIEWKFENKTIKWGDTRRKENKQQNQVVKVESEQFKNTYIYLALQPNDFPDEKIYKVFKNTINKGKMATKENTQGIKFCKQWVKDVRKENKDAKQKEKRKYGKFFPACAKIKVLGKKFGDMRAYASEEINATGERLLVVKGFNSKAH